MNLGFLWMLAPSCCQIISKLKPYLDFIEDKKNFEVLK